MKGQEKVTEGLSEVGGEGEKIGMAGDSRRDLQRGQARRKKAK